MGENCQHQNQLSMFKLLPHTPLWEGHTTEKRWLPLQQVCKQLKHYLQDPLLLPCSTNKAIIWSTAGKMPSWKCRYKTGLMFLQGCYSKATEPVQQQASKIQSPMRAAFKHCQCITGWHLRKHQVRHGRVETDLSAVNTINVAETWLHTYFCSTTNSLQLATHEWRDLILMTVQSHMNPTLSFSCFFFLLTFQSTVHSLVGAEWNA